MTKYPYDEGGTRVHVQAIMPLIVFDIVDNNEIETIDFDKK